MPNSILIINPFGVGDVLFSMPLVSAIRKGYPRSYIAYICNIRTKEILETNPNINEVFVFEREEYRALWTCSKIGAIKKFSHFWQEIKKRRFDIVFDLSLGKEYAFLCWLVGVRERRGFDYKGRGRFLTHRIKFDGFNDKPVAEYYLDLLEQTEDHRLKATDLAVVFTTDNDRIFIDHFLEEAGISKHDVLVGIMPGGGISFGKKDEERRRWAAEKFAELADRIRDRFNAKIILIWGPGEEELIDRVANRMKQKPLIAPKTTIRQMAALCKRCSIIVCSEGGPLHIANSQNVKTISIFGSVDEKVYGPYPQSENSIVITSDIECRPCYKRFKLPPCNTRQCLEDISVDDVFNCFVEMIK